MTGGSKASLHEAVAVVREIARDQVSTLAGEEERPLIGFLDRARDLADPVAASLGLEHIAYSLGSAPTRSPHVLVVWLDDGGETSDERGALFEYARDLLHPGSRLLVLGYVVTEPGSPPNPSVSELVEELGAAFGGMLHIEELRSVHWTGESLTRGVALGGTSLRVGVV